MVVQCEQCRTRFKLDDSKVGDKGVKVRCSKCRHVFIVRPEVVNASDEPDIDAIFTGLASPVPAKVTASTPGNETASEIEFSNTESTEGTERNVDSDSSEWAGEKELESAKSDSSFPFSADEYVNGPARATVTDSSGGVFETGSVTADDATDSGPDLSLFDIPETPSSEVLDIKRQDFAESEMDSLCLHNDGEDPKLSDSLEFTAPISTFSDKDSVEIQFAQPEATSTDTDVVFTATSSQAEIAPVESPLPEISGQASSLAGQTFDSTPILSDLNLSADEPPPLAIASRRKSSSVLPIFAVLVSVVLIVALAVLGFFMMNKGPDAMNRLGLSPLAKWVGLDGEEGRITLRGIKSEFLHNNELGELFVIRGEAVNEYKKPRASIQVKATVFGPNGERISSRTVYCGNLIAQNQLATLSMSRLEAAMNNQFGDSLSNLGIQPGKTIPFVIAISGVPKEASEYGLEVVGSTVSNQ